METSSTPAPIAVNGSRPMAISPAAAMPVNRRTAVTWLGVTEVRVNGRTPTRTAR